ncbi:MAG: sulfotransferase [Cyclobacteriaceae bacterium]|nr:sulfotransferase [Cyclobacteriaceae bacterium]
MRFDSILIITYGRSGSTLLQGVLNSIEGCVVRGENNNFCHHLYHAYNALLQTNYHGNENSRSAWYGGNLYDKDFFLGQAEGLLRTMLKGNEGDNIKCYGFKEIRYNPEEVHNLGDYLNFLSKIFPNVAFIFNTRNLEDVVKSKWWALRDKEEVMALLKETELNFFDFIARNRDNSFHITYEDVIGKSDKLLEMHEFLEVNYTEEAIDAVLATMHSF